MMRKKVMNVVLIQTGTSKTIQIQPYFIRYLAFSRYSRSVSTGAASQQQISSSHWSRRVTADNPHGFADKVLVRLRGIEDPVKREKEEKKLLYKRRRNEKRQSDAETAARFRDQVNERYRQQKFNAGYVMLIAVQLKNLVYSDCKLIFCPFTAIVCSHVVRGTGVSMYLTTTCVDTMRSSNRRLLMRIR
jgi:hypothetical protein